MASHQDTSTPVLNTNRFTNASLLSLSSIKTLLPEYSVADTPISEETTRFGAHEFLYAYPIRPKNTWATLHLHARDTMSGSPKSLQNRPRLPRYWSCDPVKGTVELDLDSPQNIQRISITLKGTIVLSSHTEGSVLFLNREFTVWDKSMGDPLQSDNTDLNNTQKKKVDTQLASGQFTFPFSFPFPTHADTDLIASDKDPKGTGQPQRNWTRYFTSAHDESSSSQSSQTSGHPTHTPLGSDLRRSFLPPMPQTFMEKDIGPNVAYDISVRIVHGRFKTSSKIKTNITYLPASEPLPQSQRRREAYEAGALIPCPMNDPEGWFALPNHHQRCGQNDGNLHTGVDCTLYIAQPLSYTRGSIVPCFITMIHSDGVEIENLLPSTGSPTVRLLRRLWHPTTWQGDSTPNTAGYISLTSWTYAMGPASDMNLVTHEVGRANWWIPSKEVAQIPNVRHFEGEIHLSPELQPSCAFQRFRIEYAVELLSFQTPNFTPEGQPPSSSTQRKGDIVIASNPVEIVTLHRQDEPIPTAFSEPPETYLKLRIPSQKAKFENGK